MYGEGIDLSRAETVSPDVNTEGTSPPFEFWARRVGYLGYQFEAAVCSLNRHESHLPDAIMMFLNRALVIDHVYLSVMRQALDLAGHAANHDWFDHTRAWIESILTDEVSDADKRRTISAKVDILIRTERQDQDVAARHSRHAYLELIDRAQEKITGG